MSILWNAYAYVQADLGIRCSDFDRALWQECDVPSMRRAL